MKVTKHLKKIWNNSTPPPYAPPNAHPDIFIVKRANEALLRSEADYKSLFEQSVDGIIIIAQSRIVMVNNAYCGIRHLPAEEIVGRNPLDFIHPDDRELAADRLRKNTNPGEQCSEGNIYRSLRWDGSISCGWTREQG